MLSIVCIRRSIIYQSTRLDHGTIRSREGEGEVGVNIKKKARIAPVTSDSKRKIGLFDISTINFKLITGYRQFVVSLVYPPIYNKA